MRYVATVTEDGDFDDVHDTIDSVGVNIIEYSKEDRTIIFDADRDDLKNFRGYPGIQSIEEYVEQGAHQGGLFHGLLNPRQR